MVQYSEAKNAKNNLIITTILIKYLTRNIIKEMSFNIIILINN